VHTRRKAAARRRGGKIINTRFLLSVEREKPPAKRSRRGLAI